MDVATNVATKPASERLPWAILVSAFLSWMFDAMDLQLFTLILIPSVRELLATNDLGQIAATGGLIAAVKLFAWGIGGVVFGVMADRVGRTKTMIITVLIYSVFTGLSAFAQNWWQLAALQALAAIGIGGEWSAGAALVAETWPERSRTRALQFMQLAFAVGFFAAALLYLVVGSFGWRYVLLIGATPAIITIGIRLFVSEPERWVRVNRDHRRENPWRTFTSIFSPTYRRVTIVGALVAMTLMIGSWATTTLLPVWIQHLLNPTQLQRAITLTSQAFMIVNVGAVAGYLTLMWAMNALGRRWCYFLVCMGSSLCTVVLFTLVHTLDALFGFLVIWGFFAIGGYGTVAAYLPELFPTRFRATGQGFCWNISRLVTGFGPLLSGLLVNASGAVHKSGMAIAAIYFIGMMAIWFGPETNGKSLAD